ncbi:MAG: hypothetical protein KUG68_06345 [Flavobacteriaceae bacterium]|nr:hypothetical protein [Flavobacteriaceae bacterium]
MKRIILIAVLLITITSVKAQKKEIEKARKEIQARNFVRATSYLSQAKRIFAAADNETRAEYYVVDAELKLAEKSLDAKQIELISQSLSRANNYEVTSSLKVRISQINLKIKGFSATIAASEFANKNYSNAAKLYKTAFQSSQDNSHLLKAARSHLLAKEYNDAFKSYNNLFIKGYTNAKTQYVATNVTSNKKEAFSSKAIRDDAITEGLYKNPETITTKSKLPEILRGITAASIPLNKKHEAVAIIDKAVAKMPENKMLLNQVSHLYKKLEAHDKYNAVLDQLIKVSPNDPSLYYNSAVYSAQNNDHERAKKYYKKALGVDPNYINAKINLSMLILEKDKVINDEMNDLGESETDYARYEKLKQKRINLYYEVLPYLKSIVKSQPQNEGFAKKLQNINSFISKDTKLTISQEN